MFIDLDEDSDGFLSFQELVVGFSKFMDKEQAQAKAKQMLDQFEDKKNKGNVNYNGNIYYILLYHQYLITHY